MRTLKKIGVALLLVGFSLRAGAQTFNRRYDPNYSNGGGSTAWGVEVLNDGKYAVIGNGAYSDGIFFSSIVRYLVIDATGQLLSEGIAFDTVHATYPGWSNSTHKRLDGGLVTGGNLFRTDSLGNWISRAALFLGTPAGQFDTLRVVGPDNQSWIGRQAKQTPDGGYVICGETSAVGNALQAFVIKTDAQGNEEWLQTYGGQWNDFINSTDNGWADGYVTGGNKRITSSNAQFWVQCLNDTGGVVWEKLWGGGFPESTANITVAQNGEVLVAGGWAYSNFAMARRYIARLDPADGSFIWQREYAAQVSDCALQVVKEVLPSMDLIAVGSMSLGGYSGTLLRTTAEGDSLWMRNYQYHDSFVSNGAGILRDVEPTSDGGFIAVGSALQAGPYTQDVWVVKVDSMGCLEPGCHLIQGMETQITNLRDVLTVAPNPVASGSTVQVSVALPAAFAPQGALRLTVTDAAGRMVQALQLPGPAAQLTTDNWHPGLYHLHLHDATRWISGAKLVVE
ncbi:MAG: hypothetical protein IPL52_17295 [Flavobacteriales bacterium]|nr:hypothetical protein [Flavobacteriales bacterium]